jgi:hypothetical protein
MGGADWSLYHITALSILDNNTSLYSILFGNNQDLFTKLLALVYPILGANPEQIYFFVFITSLITFKYIFLAAYEITNDKRKAQTAALLFMIWPIEFIMSITYLREMPLQCLVIISFFCFIKFIKQKKLKSIIGAAVFISLASMMHSGVIGILFVYIFIAIVYKSKKGIVALNPFKIILFVIIINLIMISPLADTMTQKFIGISNVDDIINKTQNVAGNTAYVTATPNPITDHVVITIESKTDETVHLRMFNSDGKLVWRKTSVVTAGTNAQYFNDLQSLPSGIYVIKVNKHSSVAEIKVVKL